MIKLVLHSFFVILMTLSFTAYADESKRDEAIAAVISDQIDAFAKDDEVRAFSHASPSVKLHFENPRHFILMVKRSYDMIYRPRFYEIEEVKVISGTIFQLASFIDYKNGKYKVFYEMQQQDDNSWKINGVRFRKSSDVAV